MSTPISQPSIMYAPISKSADIFSQILDKISNATPVAKKYYYQV